ncbi:MAG: hypothetical protein HRT90_12115 [Candidatus Margulisbacteria bacterium]|nr:hypothetical protein [Candidatus Margulisiibacteriota bacterium]
MTCHYLDEMDRFKICRAKGISPPTIDQLRNHCYKSPYDCPAYIAYSKRLREQGKESR